MITYPDVILEVVCLLLQSLHPQACVSLLPFYLNLHFFPLSNTPSTPRLASPLYRWPTRHPGVQVLITAAAPTIKSLLQLKLQPCLKLIKLITPYSCALHDQSLQFSLYPSTPPKHKSRRGYVKLNPPLDPPTPSTSREHDLPLPHPQSPQMQLPAPQNCLNSSSAGENVCGKC